MAKTPKLIHLTVLPAILACGMAHAQEQTWTPDHFDHGRAPSVSLPSTPGVSVGGGFSGYSAPTPPPPTAQPVPQPVKEQPPAPSDKAQNDQKGPNTASDSSLTKKDTAKPTIAQKQPVQAPKVEKKYRKGMVLSGNAAVKDGHSLVVDGHPVRLNGVEAPGLAQMCNTPSMTVWPCGSKAAQRLVQLIDGDAVTCQVVDQAGHGAAAVCSTRSIRDLGEMLVSEGFAVPNSHGRTYGAVALSAQQARKGLFIGSFIHPTRWRIQNPS